MADIDFAKKIDAVYRFAVRENKAATYALERETIDAFLKLCALVAKAAGADDCGHCEGCVIVAGLRQVLTSEIRKFMS